MTATILMFPVPPQATRFSAADRNAIIATSLAISPRWGAVFFQDDVGSELASIGRLAGGDQDAEDVFGVAIVSDGVELLEFADYSNATTHPNVGAALAALTSLAVL